MKNFTIFAIAGLFAISENALAMQPEDRRNSEDIKRLQRLFELGRKEAIARKELDRVLFRGPDGDENKALNGLQSTRGTTFYIPYGTDLNATPSETQAE